MVMQEDSPQRMCTRSREAEMASEAREPTDTTGLHGAASSSSSSSSSHTASRLCRRQRWLPTSSGCSRACPAA